MTILFLIGWTIVIFGDYPTMDSCLKAEEIINKKGYYEGFSTLCVTVKDDLGKL